MNKKLLICYGIAKRILRMYFFMEKDLINIKIAQANEILSIIILSGAINIEASKKLGIILEEMEKHLKPKNFIFNMEKVNLITSIGIGVFVNLSFDVRKRHGKIIFVGMNENLTEIFSFLKLDKYFIRCKTLKDALIFIN